jgi:hypothetical protein
VKARIGEIETPPGHRLDPGWQLTDLVSDDPTAGREAQHRIVDHAATR